RIKEQIERNQIACGGFLAWRRFKSSVVHAPVYAHRIWNEISVYRIPRMSKKCCVYSCFFAKKHEYTQHILLNSLLLTEEIDGGFHTIFKRHLRLPTQYALG